MASLNIHHRRLGDETHSFRRLVKESVLVSLRCARFYFFCFSFCFSAVLQFALSKDTEIRCERRGGFNLWSMD